MTRSPHDFRRGQVCALWWLLIVAASVGCATASSSRSPRSNGPSNVTLRPENLSAADRARVEEYLPIVEAASTRYRVDPTLVLGVIWVESKFNRHARSSAGARGLMQLMPPTARGLAKELDWRFASSYDPTFNVHAGTYLLGQNLRRFGGKKELALAAYNAGPASVKRWQREGRELPKGIQNYVAKVLRAQSYFVSSAPKRSEPSDTSPPPPSSPGRERALVTRPREGSSSAKKADKRPKEPVRPRTTNSSLPDVDDPPPRPTAAHDSRVSSARR